MKVSKLCVAASLLVLLAGCTTSGGVEGEPVVAPVEDRPAASAAQGDAPASEGAQASGAAGTGSFQGGALEDPASPLSTRVIYFDFDSSEIQPSFIDVLRAHGEYLATHPEVKIMVEGHTDERGSREYNLALGERRADAVKRVLVLNGATTEQIEGVSFGEEKPVELGGDEAAWSKNRRAELIYTQR